MSFFIPTISRIRFAAVADTPDNEKRLSEFFSTLETWDEFLASFGDDLIPGESQMGIVHEIGNTFVSDGISVPQISFHYSPPSLLFVYSFYSTPREASELVYGGLRGYFRLHASPLSYEPSEANLEGLWASLSELDLKKVGKTTFETLSREVSATGSRVMRLIERGDPLSAVRPILSSFFAEVNYKIGDLQEQLDDLNIVNEDGSFDITNYFTKTESNYLYNLRATKGELESVESSLVKKSTFDQHRLDPSHDPDYLQVGAPSVEEHQIALNRISNLENLVSQLQANNYISDITATGGLLVSGSGGSRAIDASLVPRSPLSVLLDTTSTGQTDFSLSGVPEGVPMVFLDGVLSTDHSLSGNAITFNNEVPSGTRVYCVA